jgi:8-amino-7-oxononanoate synthase
MKLEQRLNEMLENLKEKGAFRSLKQKEGLVDFCSNDYLGLARSAELKNSVAIRYHSMSQSGATGSRLLSGHHPLMEELEQLLCQFHNATSALLFNSGYDANLSLLSSIPRRGDMILFDSLVHASIHDGMRMGKADTCAFQHNDLRDLKAKLEENSAIKGQLFVVVESLYSMDGDIAPLAEIAVLCEIYGAALIVDEAHATGVLGHNGVGLVHALQLQEKVFARVQTFGKAIGGHGAAILGSSLLRDYLINFARPLIFSTAMPIHGLLHVIEAYKLLEKQGESMRLALQQKVNFFKSALSQLSGNYVVLPSNTPIQGIIVPGNAEVSAAAALLQKSGFDVRPIRYPTIPKGTERLRICVHLFNEEADIINMLDLLK